MENALINLTLALLDSDEGVTETQYDALVNVLDLSPLSINALSEILGRVDAIDDRFYLGESDAAFLRETLIKD